MASVEPVAVEIIRLAICITLITSSWRRAKDKTFPRFLFRSNERVDKEKTYFIKSQFQQSSQRPLKSRCPRLAILQPTRAKHDNEQFRSTLVT